MAYGTAWNSDYYDESLEFILIEYGLIIIIIKQFCKYFQKMKFGNLNCLKFKHFNLITIHVI